MTKSAVRQSGISTAFHDALNGQIVTTQIIGLTRRIFFDRALNAREQELGVRGGVEKKR